MPPKRQLETRECGKSSLKLLLWPRKGLCSQNQEFQQWCAHIDCSSGQLFWDFEKQIENEDFLDETVARIQLVLANDYIWWQIFIFRRLVWLKWEHIYSILHYSSPVLEIKRCKISTEVGDMIQGRLLDNRCKDWLQNGIYVPIFKLYQFSSVKYFWLFAFEIEEHKTAEKHLWRPDSANNPFSKCPWQ